MLLGRMLRRVSQRLRLVLSRTRKKRKRVDSMKDHLRRNTILIMNKMFITTSIIIKTKIRMHIMRMRGTTSDHT